MTVRPEVKARRRRIVGDYIRLEHARTGRNAHEQWEVILADLNPVHERINRRAELEEAAIPWWPGQTTKDRERLRTKIRVEARP